MCPTDWKGRQVFEGDRVYIDRSAAVRVSLPTGIYPVLRVDHSKRAGVCNIVVAVGKRTAYINSTIVELAPASFVSHAS